MRGKRDSLIWEGKESDRYAIKTEVGEERDGRGEDGGEGVYCYFVAEIYIFLIHFSYWQAQHIFGLIMLGTINSTY